MKTKVHISVYSYIQLWNSLRDKQQMQKLCVTVYTSGHLRSCSKSLPCI